MKRLRIEHETGFRYPSDVTASYNEVRMTPVTTERQLVMTTSLDIAPHTAVSTYVDYFGTHVAAFEVLTAHDDLTITARSVVEVRPRDLEPVDLTWAELAAAAAAAVPTVEQIAQTPRTEPHEEVRAIAAGIAAAEANPDRAAQEILRAVAARVRYVPGATDVSTTAADAWAAGEGVCQDITHIALGALRSVGIPARYVSGYLHPQAEPAIGETVTGESHAWVEWFAGEWRGWDPTNAIEICDRHVQVGRGRDYTDVPPLRGVYAGPSGSELGVRVAITREA
ncbi:transglutaminase family protein [Microbacterium indicum]|uniref:transglutaminase family protein n=1 Tax=Microbacterium indicum TaxID=358100 RepID=UPI0004124B22|nr:transglutaminase family protein [Microbacterium indicum]